MIDSSVLDKEIAEVPDCLHANDSCVCIRVFQYSSEYIDDLVLAVYFLKNVGVVVENI